MNKLAAVGMVALFALAITGAAAEAGNGAARAGAGIGGGGMRGGGPAIGGGGMRVAPVVPGGGIGRGVGGGQFKNFNPGMPRAGNWKPSYNPGMKPHRPGGVKPGWSGHAGQGHHRHRPRLRYYGVPTYYYLEDYSYRGDGCGWLWQRWLATGNRKWKIRYYDCIE